MTRPHSGGTRFSVGQVRRDLSSKFAPLNASFAGDANDAFWLAQTYFMTHQYSRAERLLTRPFPTSPSKIPDIPLATNGHVSHFQSTTKGKGREYDASQLMLSMPRLPMGPGGLIELPEDMHDRVSRLVDMSVACRYLAALCQVRQGHWNDAIEMLGEANPFGGSGNVISANLFYVAYIDYVIGRSGPAVPNVDGGIKVTQLRAVCSLPFTMMFRSKRLCAT